MKTVRIWFNHWFSTVYHIINLIREDSAYRYEIVGSNENEIAVYKQACDEWYREPANLSDDAYADFCVGFCKEHGIDIFAPRKKLDVISKNAARFESEGIRLLVDSDYSTVGILENKALTYSFVSECVPQCLPQWRVARSFGEFEICYHELLSTEDRVCYKLVADEGARSFRVVDDSIEGVGSLYEKPGSKITFNAAKNVLKEYNFHVPILLMPYLCGVEVSADCTATAKGNLIIPRFKTNKRYSEIIFDEDLMAVCNDLMSALKLTNPLNIQFKKGRDRFYLLEINPRMSGGVPLSCKATGINLPLIAIHRLLGKDDDWSYPEGNAIKVVHIETPICLS